MHILLKCFTSTISWRGVKAKSPKAKSPKANSPRMARRSSASSADLIKKNILFSNLSPKTLSSVRKHLVLTRYSSGETIFDENSKGRDLYLILKGKVHLKKYTKEGIQSLLGVLHEGDFFGELSLIGNYPRSAKSEAATDCIIAQLGYEHYQRLLADSKVFSQNLMQRLALRLRTLDRMFVGELERHTKALNAQVTRLEQLTEASKIVNSTIDSDRLLELILETATTNIKAERGTLYLIDQLTNELWSKVLKGKNLVEIRLPIGKGLAGYVAKTGETVNITNAYKDPRFNPEIDKKSGFKTRNVLCMPLRDKEGTVVGVFQLLNKKSGPFTPEDEQFIDALSVHAAIALENSRLVKQLVQSERLSAIGRMASTIIHDIKNPMATMRIYAQVIKRKAENQEAAEIAEMMIRQVDRFVNMTQEILDFSRGVSDIKLETVALSEVLPAVFGFIEHDFEKKNIVLVKELEYTGPIRIDQEKMMRVFQNLAGNAADAMPNGGTFTIRVTKNDSRIRFEFTDTGTGMTDEVRAKAFEPFFTRGKRHGTGLGLAIVKKIVEDHNGTIELDSSPENGTTIRILLPFS